MSNQTKIGLLMGLGVILLVGIIVSDHLSSNSQNAIQSAGPALTHLGEKNPTNQNDQIRQEFLGPSAAPMPVAFGQGASNASPLPPVLLGMDTVGTKPALLPPTAPTVLRTPVSAPVASRASPAPAIPAASL